MTVIKRKKMGPTPFERGEGILITIPSATEEQRRAAIYVLETKNKMGKLPGFTDCYGDTLSIYLDMLGLEERELV